MFIKKSNKFIIEINSDVTIYEHDKTKARLCTIVNDDPNKVFSIAFRTPPKDNTGLTHILEHSVLCGSSKYPVKDPFVELMKGSLNTFLNAFTFPDKTMYPVASMNDKDFKNLMSVYLDAVFYPNIYKYEEIFRQEGWHYHLLNKDDDISINGVVYNEMKGAFSDPEQVLSRNIMHSLYPNTPYGLESGGDPKYIPTLTYESFKDFHSKYYHPSNSYIFLYGNCDMEERMNFIENEYLNNFEYNDFDTFIPFEKPFKETKYETHYYPIDKEKSLKDNTYLSYNVALDTTLDIKKSIAFEVLAEVLFNVPGAPVKEALLKASICEDVETTYESGILQPFFSIVLKKSNKENIEDFINILETTLKDIHIDEEALLASLNYMEFKTREAKFDGPKGLLYEMNALDSWLYDDNMPFEKLCVLDYYKELKECIGSSYFNDLINEWLLANTHKSIVSLEPSYTISKEEEEILKTNLKEYKDSLSKEEIEKLIEDNKNLVIYQDTPSTKEEIDTLPKLEITDLNPLPIKYNIKAIENDYKIYHSDYFTNGIIYTNYTFDITNLCDSDLKYAKLLSSILGLMSTNKYTYNEINKYIKLHSGGIFNLMTYIPLDDDNYRIIYQIQASFVENEAKSSNDLIINIKDNTLLNDKKRFKELINKMYLNLEQGLSRNGHLTAINRAGSYVSKSYFIKDLISGIRYLDFIKDISLNLDNKFDEVISNLNRVSELIFTKSNFIFHTTCDKELLDTAILSSKELYDTLNNNRLEIVNDITPIKLNEGIKIQSNVNYVAQFGILKSGFKGDLLVLKNALSLDYLWANIRVKGGAYGAMINIGKNGELCLVSYRDPNIINTKKVYDNIGNFINNLKSSEEDVLKYKIGAIGALDDSMHVSSMGSQAFIYELAGITYERRTQIRKDILEASLEGIKKYADIFEEAINENNICVVGNPKNIDEASSMFDNIRNLD